MIETSNANKACFTEKEKTLILQNMEAIKKYLKEECLKLRVGKEYSVNIPNSSFTLEIKVLGYAYHNEVKIAGSEKEKDGWTPILFDEDPNLMYKHHILATKLDFGMAVIKNWPQIKEVIQKEIEECENSKDVDFLEHFEI